MKKTVKISKVREYAAQVEAVSGARVLGFYIDTRLTRYGKALRKLFEDTVGVEVEESAKRVQERIEEFKKEAKEKYAVDGKAYNEEINRLFQADPVCIEQRQIDKDLMKKEVEIDLESLMLKEELFEQKDDDGNLIDISTKFPQERVVEIAGSTVKADPYTCFLDLIEEGLLVLEKDYIEEKTKPKPKK